MYRHAPVCLPMLLRIDYGYAVLFFMIQRYVMRFKMYYKAMVLIKVNIILND